MLEDGSLPDVIECDTVATCAVMVRADAVKQNGVGIMPEDNFIYWDDMEWGYRIKLAGYRVVTLAEAKALHQMGANTRKENTFINYYMWRNRTNFFMRFTPEAQMEAMSVKVLGQCLMQCMRACFVKNIMSDRQFPMRFMMRWLACVERLILTKY